MTNKEKVQQELQRLPYIQLKEKVCGTINRSIEQMKSFLPEELVDDEDTNFISEQEFARLIVNEVNDAYRINLP